MVGPEASKPAVRIHCNKGCVYGSCGISYIHTENINNGFPEKLTPNLSLEESLVISWVAVSLKGFLDWKQLCSGFESQESVYILKTLE